MYSTGWVDFQNSTRRWGGGGGRFFSHPGSAFYSVEPPTGANFLPTATPPRSLHETAHLPVWERGGWNAIANGYTDNACDVGMIDRCICLKVADKYYN